VDTCIYSRISKVLLSTYGDSLSLRIEAVNISGCICNCRTLNYRLDPKHLGPLTPSLGYLLHCPHSGLTPDWLLPKVPLQHHPAGRNFPIRYLSLPPTANPKPRWSDPMPSYIVLVHKTHQLSFSLKICVEVAGMQDKQVSLFKYISDTQSLIICAGTICCSATRIWQVAR
jgi:hypothetical protein